MRGAGKRSSSKLFLPCGIDLLHLLLHLKEAGTAGNPKGFQRRRHRQTDRLVRSALIRHHQMGIQRIQISFPAFHGSKKRF